MKLKEFNASNSQSIRSGLSQGMFFGKTGLIGLNKALCAQLGVKAMDTVTLYQDEDNPDEWYIARTEGGFSLHAPKKDGACSFGSSETCREFCKATGLSGTVSLRVATQPVDDEHPGLYAILTGSSKQEKTPEWKRNKN